MNKFTPIRFDAGDKIFAEGQNSREVYFVTGGKVLNVTTNRRFLVGSMIGHEDLLYDRKRDSTVEAETEVFTLRLERETLEKIFSEYPEIPILLR